MSHTPTTSYSVLANTGFVNRTALPSSAGTVVSWLSLSPKRVSAVSAPSAASKLVIRTPLSPDM